MEPAGLHCILELYDCPLALLNDVAFARQALMDAAQRASSTLIKHVSHEFSPHGITVVGLLAESHLSIHTWPERRYVAVDFFTCGTTSDPKKACLFLVSRFKAGHYELVEMPRGTRKALSSSVATSDRDYARASV